jgi:hypothetical protein
MDTLWKKHERCVVLRFRKQVCTSFKEASPTVARSSKHSACRPRPLWGPSPLKVIWSSASYLSLFVSQVKTVRVEKRINEVVNRLNKTKVEKKVDLKGDHITVASL